MVLYVGFDCFSQLTLIFMILHLYLSVIHDKYQIYKYEKHTREICQCGGWRVRRLGKSPMRASPYCQVGLSSQTYCVALEIQTTQS